MSSMSQRRNIRTNFGNNEYDDRLSKHHADFVNRHGELDTLQRRLAQAKTPGIFTKLAVKTPVIFTNLAKNIRRLTRKQENEQEFDSLGTDTSGIRQLPIVNNTSKREQERQKKVNAMHTDALGLIKRVELQIPEDTQAKFNSQADILEKRLKGMDHLGQGNENEEALDDMLQKLQMTRPTIPIPTIPDFPSVPTDPVVLIPKTQLPVPANIKKVRNPHNHLLMFYALFIFDFLEKYYKHTKELCKIIRKSKNREIKYSVPFRLDIQKAYEELKKIYNNKQFAAGEDILKTIIREIPVLLNTIHLILKDINIFNAIWGHNHSTDSENSKNRVELVGVFKIYELLNDKMKKEYGSSIQSLLTSFSGSKDINKEANLSIKLNDTLPSLIYYVEGIGTILKTIGTTLMNNTTPEIRYEGTDLFEGIDDSLTQFITKFKQGSTRYNEFLNSVISNPSIDNLDKKIGSLQPQFGGRRKPTKPTAKKPKKSNHADMNMKDIRRLCKANQIKLSTTKDGVRIIYKKKELITKLRRKKIL
jgi:hypothetical protein